MPRASIDIEQQMEEGNWSQFRDELSSVDGELLRYPERIFYFHHIQQNILITQSIDSIGTLIWDAEVILAHYIDRIHHENGLEKKLLLEIGAGTALASIVAGKCGAHLFLQELEEVIEESRIRLEQNNINAHCVSGLWGNDLAIQILQISQEYFDYIAMADVLYHPEHFHDLKTTILSCSKIGTEVIIVYELRRRDLESYFASLSENFEVIKIICYDVVRHEDDVSSSESCTHTKFYIHHLRRTR